MDYVYSAKANKPETTDDSLSVSDKTSWMFGLFEAVIGGKAMNVMPPVPVSLMGASPHEGLALVDAYMKISDPSVRQALLDLMSLVAASDV